VDTSRSQVGVLEPERKPVSPFSIRCYAPTIRRLYSISIST
jgi:hypothetical protein